jgi:hypothetical protein
MEGEGARGARGWGTFLWADQSNAKGEVSAQGMEEMDVSLEGRVHIGMDKSKDTI